VRKHSALERTGSRCQTPGCSSLPGPHEFGSPTSPLCRSPRALRAGSPPCSPPFLLLRRSCCRSSMPISTTTTRRPPSMRFRRS
jgi:hypothetical protein